MMTGTYADGSQFEADAIETDSDGAQWPVVFCEKVTRYRMVLWRFKCRYCGSWHFHSAVPGHHMAHCAETVQRQGRKVATNAAYNGHGYILRLAPEGTAKGHKWSQLRLSEGIWT